MLNIRKKEKFITSQIEWSVKVRKWWAIIVFMFFVLVLSVLVFNLRIFWMSGKNNSLPDAVATSNSLKLDSTKLENVLKKFEQKALNSNEIINSKSTVSDPSI